MKSRHYVRLKIHKLFAILLANLVLLSTVPSSQRAIAAESHNVTAKDAAAKPSSWSKIKGNNTPWQVDFSIEPVAISPKTSPAVIKNSTRKTEKEPITENLSQKQSEAILSKLAPFTIKDEQSPALPDIAPNFPKLAVPSPETTSDSQANTDTEQIRPRPLSCTASHKGQVSEIKQLAITFSKPMIAVGRIEAVKADKYVTLSPQPPGEWQWAGTQTLLFVPKGDRFPQATEYTVTIPETVMATDGSKLEKQLTWRITTPAVKLTSFYPTDLSSTAQSCSPLMEAFFNQNIDSKRLFKYISLQANSKEYPLTLLQNRDLKSTDFPFKNPKTRSESRNWIAFKPAAPLPKNCTATITFAKHLPSAEGPLVDSVEQERQIKTFGPLRLLKREVAGRAGNSHDNSIHQPEQSATFDFSNQLDEASFRSEMVEVDPRVEKLSVECKDNHISLKGLLKPFSQYQVTFSRNIQDSFGQTLGSNCHGLIKTQDLSLDIEASDNDKFATLSPGQPIIHSFWAQGAPAVRVTVYRVAPEDWTIFNLPPRNAMPIEPGEKLSSRDYTIPPQGKQFNLDLTSMLKNKYGHLLVKEELLTDKESLRKVDYYWYQITDMAIDSFGVGRLTVMASRLADSKPLEEVELTLAYTPVKEKTDCNGLATIEIPHERTLAYTLIGRKGADSCILTVINNTRFLDGPRYRPLSWYAKSDRTLYRPGEKICVNGWLRARETDRENPGLKLLDLPKDTSVSYILQDERRTAIVTGDARIDEHGGFSFEATIPKSMQLGNAYVFIVPTCDKEPLAICNSTEVPIKIQEFRRPEFEMAVSSSRGNSLILGQSTILSSKTNYLAGGGLAKSPLTWTVGYAPTIYSPPGWQQFQFSNNYSDSWNSYNYHARNRAVKTLTTETDATGCARTTLKLNNMSHPTPVTCFCEATVTDLNRQQWSEKIDLLVHPAEIYVGISQGRWGIKPGESINFGLIATNIGGKIQPGTTIDLILSELNKDGETIKTTYQQISLKDKPEEISYKTSATARRVTCEALVTDAKQRCNMAAKEVFLYDEQQFDYYHSRNSRTAGSSCTLTGNKTEYKPGEIAEVKLQTTVFPATGVFMIVKGAVVSTIPLKITGPETVIKFPISQSHYPSINAQVFLTRDRQTFACGQVKLEVPPAEKTLQISVKPSAESARPGQETTLELELKDKQNNPVAHGQIALAVVDEAVLALSRYKLPDPIDIFYNDSFWPMEARHSREMARGLMLYVANSRIISGRIGESGSSGKESGKPQCYPTTIRGNFSALALFRPGIETDSTGKARVRFKLPDSITRYKIMAVAAAGTDKFGAAESTLTASLPLAIKPSPPRFLNFGDKCQLPIVLQNLTDKSLQTEIAIRAQNAVIAEPGKVITVPAHDRVQVSFTTTATGLGQASFQCAAKADNVCDAAEFSLPVLLPASAETFAACGTIDGGSKGTGLQKITRPQEVYSNLGGLTLSTSSSAMQFLSGAYTYLLDYPYTCSEQISSRLIALLAVQDSLTAFGRLGGEEKEKFEQCIQSDLDLLKKRQNSSGGFGLWSAKERNPWPFVSIQATRALTLAAEKKYHVNQGDIKSAMNYLRHIEEHIPAEFDERTRQAIIARALNVRHLAGEDDGEAARKLVRKAAMNETAGQDQAVLSAETAAWLLPILDKSKAYDNEVETLRTVISSKLLETTSTATCVDYDYDIWNYSVFASQARSEAAILEALIEDQPQSLLIPKLVKNLQQRARGGNWIGTQENSYVLQALNKYFSIYEKETPDFQAQTWLNDTLIANQKFSGRSTEAQSITLSTRYLEEHPCDQIQIDKSGPGRLYYRLALNYVPKDGKPLATNRGFKVIRTYEPIDDAADVRRDELGSWHLKAGARVKVKVRFETPGTKYHVAMVAPLPAGAEPINSKLLGVRTMSPVEPATQEGSSERESDGEIDYTTNRNYWYEHENLRDQQAEAFTSRLEGGSYEYSYSILATTPGHYLVQPVKVEEMYAPETFGRNDAEIVIVE